MESAIQGGAAAASEDQDDFSIQKANRTDGGKEAVIDWIPIISSFALKMQWKQLIYILEAAIELRLR